MVVMGGWKRPLGLSHSYCYRQVNNALNNLVLLGNLTLHLAQSFITVLRFEICDEELFDCAQGNNHPLIHFNDAQELMGYAYWTIIKHFIISHLFLWDELLLLARNKKEDRKKLSLYSIKFN